MLSDERDADQVASVFLGAGATGWQAHCAPGWDVASLGREPSATQAAFREPANGLTADHARLDRPGSDKTMKFRLTLP